MEGWKGDGLFCPMSTNVFAPTWATFQYQTIKDCFTITCMLLLLPSGHSVAPSCVPAVTNQIRIAVDSRKYAATSPAAADKCWQGLD